MGGPDLGVMAYQYRESAKLLFWTLIAGFLCCPLIWIVSFIEYNKLQNIKVQLASMGVNFEAWAMAHQAKYNGL